jgi:hypothetical protein
MAQSSSMKSKAETTLPPAALQREFFDAIRAGDAQKVLSYIAKGVNVGPEMQHVAQDQVEHLRPGTSRASSPGCGRWSLPAAGTPPG